MAYFDVLDRKRKKITKIFSQESRYTARDLKPGLSGCETGMLLNRPRCSARVITLSALSAHITQRSVKVIHRIQHKHLQVIFPPRFAATFDQ
jgi:hypothetical protein